VIHTYPAVSLPCHEYAVLKATYQGHGRVAAGERHDMCELAFNTAGERHGICESAFMVPKDGCHNYNHFLMLAGGVSLNVFAGGRWWVFRRLDDLVPGVA
jgi:hypothetical protein